MPARRPRGGTPPTSAIVPPNDALPSVQPPARPTFAPLSAADALAVLHRLPDAVVVVDAAGRISHVNDVAELHLSRRRGSLLGRALAEVEHEGRDRELFGGLRRAAEGGERATFEVYRAATGVWLEVHSEPVGGGLVARLQDVTARKCSQQALGASEERYRILFESSPRPMWVYDAQSLRLLAVNEAAVAQYGYSREEFLDMTIRDLRPAAEVARLDELVPVLGPGFTSSGGWRHRRKDGTLIDVEVTSHALDFAGRSARLVLATDVTDRKRAEADRERSLSLVRAALESTADGLLVVDREGRITAWNGKFLEMWRIPPALAAARDDARIMAHTMGQLRRPDEFAARVRELHSDPAAASEDVLEFTDGRVFERYSRPQRVGDDILGRVWSFRDVTERRRLEAELTHQAYHDALTGLANRARFRDRVVAALDRAGGSPERIAVLFLDLDDFKRVNDSFGHAEGDRLLREVGERLLACTRGCDTVARLGGDEFAVLLTNVRDEAGIVTAAERITRAMDAPVSLRGALVTVGVSIGIASAAHATYPDALLRNADVAMYGAKARGKGRHLVFEPAMHAAVLMRLQLEDDLRGALAGGDFHLDFQPIVRLATGEVTGAEALVRWTHAERGLVEPARFIPLAEETGLIVPLGAWVLREACRQGRDWFDRHGTGPGGVPFTVSVNISARQLAEPTFVQQVRNTLEESRLHPSSLVLEITESVLMRDTETMVGRMRALKALGVRLAVDDFGTGYSSLSYLHRFPVDILKIDKSFVDAVGSGRAEPALARAIVALGESLGLTTVAEGIEREAQRAGLVALRCELGQGYLFARPGPAAELTPRLELPTLAPRRRIAV